MAAAPSGAQSRAVDTVFVGGGVIGLSAAWAAAKAGLSVRLFDPAPGRGASWAAAGMLAPVSEAAYGEEDLVALLVAGAAAWAPFAAELTAVTGQDFDYRQCGTVTVALDASDRAAVDELAVFRRSIGLEANPLSASAARQLVPALAPGIRGGAIVPGDHQVNNRRLVGALADACASAGVEMVPARVDALLRSAAGAACGVEAAGVRTDAGSVVLCMGWETSALPGVPAGILPAVRPVKGHVLRLRDRPGRPLLDRTVRGLVRGDSCYLVPRRDGTLVVGATVEERGEDRSVQAGAVHTLLDRARALVPGIDELELEECVTGLRPGSPDNAPFIGWTEVARLAVAAGHYRNGILLAPITAQALGELLADRPLPPVVAPFDARRVAKGAAGVLRAAPGAARGG
ncbi:MAG TPA: glycine oxidase ThiO [Acidimicrobiales bacterium]|nr:glycine oxidase ThiO [Acidimicrobiales bacterium]